MRTQSKNAQHHSVGGGGQASPVSFLPSRSSALRMKSFYFSASSTVRSPTTNTHCPSSVMISSSASMLN